MDELTPKEISSLTKFGKSFLQAKYSSFITPWLSTATKNEIKGLKVAEAVVKTQGLKKFKKKENEGQVRLGSTNEQLRKKYMTTFYNSEFCMESMKNSSEIEILKFKKIGELAFSQILSAESLRYLENWLELNDDQLYQALLLSFLRGLYSLIKTNTAVPNSSHRENFAEFSLKERKNAVHKAHLIPKPSNFKKPQLKPRAFSTCLEIPSLQIPMFYDFTTQKRRNLQNLSGNGEITSWVSDFNGMRNSVYQQTYQAFNLSPAKPFNSDFNTSIIGRLLPNT